MTNLELTRKILEIMGHEEDKIEFVKDRPGHDLRYAIDFTKAKEELGWEPEINFEEGFRQMVEWYKENREWWERIKSGDYQNYYNKQYAA